MEIRDATVADAADLAAVARASLAESYGHFVDEETIDAAVEEWYDEDLLGDQIGGDVALCQVAVEGDERVEDGDGDEAGRVVGFVQGAEIETDPLVGEIHWLHVAPDARGRGIALQLLGRAQEAFAERGAERLRGLVLAENETGTGFYEGHGFERVDVDEATVGDRTIEEYVYEKPIDDGHTEPVVEAIRGPEDRELFVNFSDAERGVRAPFYPVFGSRTLEDRYGWYCGDCESLDNTMDSMGRIVCNDCGNKRKATRWDASYL